MRAVAPEDDVKAEIARFYVDSVTANIQAFLDSKPKRFELWIDRCDLEVVRGLWQAAGFQGDRDSFIAGLTHIHNAS
jgi:hypothetical protein